VVATQWRVKDNAAHALMREFYKRLWAKKGPGGRAEALRRAQLWMIKEWDGDRGWTEREEEKGPLPPFFWAAFSLSGDWR
jgi:CHAT domain-containing protein